MNRVITLRLGSFFPEIFLKKMRVYRVKKRSDRQMAPFGQILGSASLRSNVVGLASPRLLILKRNLNGFSPGLQSRFRKQAPN